jgi:glycosyltransferase involved in cell wall biosynthesis
VVCAGGEGSGFVTDSPTVSIVIPTYNRAGWLPVSVGSVIAQTYPDWELILVDDHSTDDTPALARKYAAEDARIRVVLNQRQRGPAGARNHGVDLSRGKFIAFLDSDDEWHDFHLQRMVDYLSRYPDRLDLMTANAVRKRYPDGEVYRRTDLDLTLLRYERLEDACLFDPEALFEMSLQRSLVITQTMVGTRELFNQIRFDEELPPGPEDRLFHLEVAYHRKNVAHLPECHVTYWAHGDNLTCCGGTRDPAASIPLFLAYEQLEHKCLQKFQFSPAIRRRVCENLARLCFWKIGYNGYLRSGDYHMARRYFWKGIRLDPFRVAYWKTLLLSFPRQIVETASDRRLGPRDSRRQKDA